MVKIKENAEKLSDFLRKNEIPHVLFVDIDDDTMVSMCVSKESMFDYLMAAVKEIPELKEPIIEAAEQMKVKIVHKPVLLN